MYFYKNSFKLIKKNAHSSKNNYGINDSMKTLIASSKNLNLKFWWDLMTCLVWQKMNIKEERKKKKGEKYIISCYTKQLNWDWSSSSLISSLPLSFLFLVCPPISSN